MAKLDERILAAASLVLAIVSQSGPVHGRNDNGTMPVSELRPGMKGHAMTVFSGKTPDRFDIEIIDVIPGYLPKQDAVLFRATDPRLKHSGIVGGMSGSPVYVGGKLVGAIAYGYRFNKDPIGGITPISNMLQVEALPFRPEVLPKPFGRAREGVSGWADAMLGLDTSPLPPRRRPDETGLSGGLVPLGAPLSVSGFGPLSTRWLSEQLGLMAVRGGSSDPADAATPHRFRPGDAVSVVLVRGDNSAAPNGTVTWVGGKRSDRLMAFGHPMFGEGPSNLPVANARVHVIIPSLDRSVKISSPLSLQGAMVQDRQAGISLRTDVDAPLIPVTTTLKAAESELPVRTYQSEVALAVSLTPTLVGGLLLEAVEEGGLDATDLVLELQHDITLETSKGPRTVKLRDEMFFPGGIDPRVLGRARGMITLAAALDNEFEIAKIQKVVQRATLAYGLPVELIEEVRIPPGEVRAGDIVDFEVKLRQPRGHARSERIALRIPDDAGGQDIHVEFAGGADVRPYRPIAASLDDLLDTISQAYPARSIVASIYRESEGLSTRSGLIHGLPDSVLETLAASGTTRESVRMKQLARRVLASKNLIEGEHSIRIAVKPKRTL